ncbi:hypothetical protein MAR_011869 [Mya arenaria]|uniref:Uncharacterized protein n=1 Tax=Mya arenaria TaxID=6604 RepID=A0ABY7FVE9_MYAAR|nr:hypothetical protein MAR_011869 [Mya arenaria]
MYPNAVHLVYSKTCQTIANTFNNDVRVKLKKYDVLRDLWTTRFMRVLNGHTLEDKWTIYETSKKCVFKSIIVVIFNQMTSFDDVFMKDLIAKGEDPETLWASSEITQNPIIALETEF